MANFPKGFLWGAASASYQIEGGVKEGGRGESIWDVFSRTPGKVKNGESGAVAADSYHRWQEDVALLKDMGLGAYRFSLAWPRIAPDGDTKWNQNGFDYYDGIVNALLDAGIEPWVTLYHWDLPQALQNKGGWQNRDTAYAFAAYAKKAAEHFKGRVKHWFTINEPQCFIGLGYGNGTHAPGLQLGMEELAACWSNALLAHALATDALRQTDSGNLVGLASTGNIFYPVSDAPQDIKAARDMTFSCTDRGWTFSYAMALDPVALGRWPHGLGTRLHNCMDSCGDFFPMGKPDFIGLNIYNGIAVRAGEKGPEEVPYPIGGPRTAMGWPVTPGAMEWGARFIGERYGLPLYISENGLACRDKVFLDGKVHDPERIDFLTRYLQALSAAIAAGTDVRGYFHWALTDNFEWAEGYDPRFGLIYVDYPTGKRIPKDSAQWYKKLAACDGEQTGVL